MNSVPATDSAQDIQVEMSGRSEETHHQSSGETLWLLLNLGIKCREVINEVVE